ncbi:unnamed protein product, partial [Prorocentrum cordatum]
MGADAPSSSSSAEAAAGGPPPSDALPAPAGGGAEATIIIDGVPYVALQPSTARATTATTATTVTTTATTTAAAVAEATTPAAVVRDGVTYVRATAGEAPAAGAPAAGGAASDEAPPSQEEEPADAPAERPGEPPPARQRAPMPGWTDEEASELRKIFDFFDKDGDELIDVHELGDVMSSRNQDLTEAELKIMIHGVKSSGSEALDYSSFISLLAQIGLKLGGPASAAGSDRQDCDVDLENWETAWSEEKLAWCCEHEQRGCPQAPGAGTGTSTSAPPGAFQGFDCAAGFDNWGMLWPKEKVGWCCKHEQRACEGPGSAEDANPSPPEISSITDL